MQGKSKAVKACAPHFYWGEEKGKYLITNDAGHYAWLDKAAFLKFSKGALGEKDKAFNELLSKGFVRDRLDFNGLARKWKSRNAHLFSGPGLHIFVLTLRCNHKCLYCQSGALDQALKGADMNWATARRSVDLAFQTPAPGLTIEFQGGEPLLNWDVLKKTVAYARKKEKATGKDLELALVSNFSLMTEEKARFLLANQVSICTSLDGPADLHNANRPYAGGSSQARTKKWLKYFMRLSANPPAKYKVFNPSALLTVTRRSLGSHREIVDEYVGLGLKDIFLRPLSPIGYAKKSWGTIGYSPAEFVEFYRKSLEYILKLNRGGVVIREKFTAILLEKILGERDPGYLDLRCPCGAGIGQVAYNYNGDIYTCDEGRMVALEGDELFKIGNVYRDGYKKVVTAPAARACVLASELHSQPECSRCVYSPYCGVCPVYNYETQGSLWGNMPSNGKCAFMKAIFGVLFEKLRDPRDKELLQTWMKKR